MTNGILAAYVMIAMPYEALEQQIKDTSSVRKCFCGMFHTVTPAFTIALCTDSCD